VDWRTRAIVHRVEVGSRVVTAVAPCPEDIIVSKLARLDEKDRKFIENFHAVRPLDPEIIERDGSIEVPQAFEASQR
jgi:hypothetical protein